MVGNRQKRFEIVETEIPARAQNLYPVRFFAFRSIFRAIQIDSIRSLLQCSMNSGFLYTISRYRHRACQLSPDAFALISHPERSWAKAPFRQVNGSVSPLQPLINMRKKTVRDAMGAACAAAVSAVRAR